jgi:hypothetical protein
MWLLGQNLCRYATMTQCVEFSDNDTVAVGAANGHWMFASIAYATTIPLTHNVKITGEADSTLILLLYILWRFAWKQRDKYDPEAVLLVPFYVER